MDKSASTEGNRSQVNIAAEGHLEAAKQHDLASLNHKEAARLHESGDQRGAVHHALIAHAHTIRAVEHEKGVMSQETTSPIKMSSKVNK
jgi:hypothetical protein